MTCDPVKLIYQRIFAAIFTKYTLGSLEYAILNEVKLTIGCKLYIMYPCTRRFRSPICFLDMK